MANKKAKQELDKLPDTQNKTEKKETPFELLLKEIEEKFNVKVEPIKNVTYKIEKVIDYIQSHYAFRFNEITRELEYHNSQDNKFVYLDNRDLDSLLINIKKANHSIGKDLLKTLLWSDSVSVNYNPFEDYFFNLPKWDGKTDHIKEFLQQVKLKDESERGIFIETFTKWLTAMTASLLTDGIVNQQCFVLVGGQGIFKTTFLNNLVPKHLQLDYLYSSKFNFENKDHFKYLGTKMLINMDELASLTRTDDNIFKTILTDDRVIVRLPYGSVDSKMWRKASFCGSTNNKEFLKDETGNRRFLIFEVETIEFDRSYCVDNIYSQALGLFKSGFQFWFDRTDIGVIEGRNEEFRDIAIEQELIQRYLAKPSQLDLKTNTGFELLSASDINIYLAGKSNRVNVNETTKRRLVQVLKKLGFNLIQKRLNGSTSPSRLYPVKKVDVPMVDGEGLLNQCEVPI